MKCKKCGSKYMQKRPSEPDTDWVCVGCGDPVDFRESPDNDTDNGMRMLAYFILAVVLMISPVCALLFQVLRVMK